MAATIRTFSFAMARSLDTTTFGRWRHFREVAIFTSKPVARTVYGLDDDQGPRFMRTEADTLRQRATVEGFTFDVRRSKPDSLRGDGLAMRASDKVVFVAAENSLDSRRGVLGTTVGRQMWHWRYSWSRTCGTVDFDCMRTARLSIAGRPLCGIDSFDTEDRGGG